MPFNEQKIELPLLNPTTKVQKDSYGPGNIEAREYYTKYLCDESIQLINEYYADDFDETGYEKIIIKS